MLKQRIITALILIPITLLILFYLPISSFCLLTALICLGGAWEWTNLMGIVSKSWRFAYLGLIAFMLFGALFVPVQLIFTIAFIWWVIALGLISLYPRGNFLWNGLLIRGAMGILVILPCWVAINAIRGQEQGLSALLFLFVLIWGADSAAYFVGKKWGKTKLAPKVSPGKSIQGAVGALLFSLLITLVGLLIAQMPFAQWGWIMAMTLTVVIFSIVGDLFESMLKREVGVKDSGTLLPGHGGLLDRIDSLTAAAPVFAFLSWVLSMYL